MESKKIALRREVENRRTNWPVSLPFIHFKSSGLEKGLSKYHVFYPHNIPYSNSSYSEFSNAFTT
jgi:hypothetical protein